MSTFQNNIEINNKSVSKDDNTVKITNIDQKSTVKATMKKKTIEENDPYKTAVEFSMLFYIFLVAINIGTVMAFYVLRCILMDDQIDKTFLAIFIILGMFPLVITMAKGKITYVLFGVMIIGSIVSGSYYINEGSLLMLSLCPPIIILIYGIGCFIHMMFVKKNKYDNILYGKK